ncbi:Disease resistance protein RPM1 [Glycine soja]
MPKLQEIAVSLAVDYLLPPIKKAVNSVMEVPKDAADMNDKLDGIQAMIHDADKMAAAEEGNSRDGLKAKVKQLVETSFCMEDIVDEYIIHEERQLADDPGCASLPCKAVDFVKTTASRLQFAYMNQDVKSEFHGIKEGNKSEDCSQIQSSGGNQNITFDNLRMAPLFLKEAEVVGFDSPRDTLERWLKEGREKLTVVSVVGMGGSGKTTLAKKVFDKVQTHFTRHVWITVSQSYTIEGLLLKFLEAEKGKDSSQSVYSTMDKASLIHEVRNHLSCNRYVVVFDDVWNENFWEEMKFALVDVENGSRIIITTRHREVAESCRTSSLVQVHELQPLTDDKSFELFCKTAFRSELDGHCPHNLKGISTEIVKKCEGLPLAIVATGGLLSRKSRDAREWQRFSENLSSELGKHPKLTPVTKILGLSYYDLPYHLKPCFLYFGIYPEDYEVECGRLILQWVAEGFVKSDEAAQTLEEVAEKYLNELIQRSLVQVSSFTWSGKIKRCRVHDVVREMIREKNQDLSFCHSASERGNLSRSGMIRRLTIASGSNNLTGSVESSNIRSLHVFSDEELSESLVKSMPTKYRLLRVLQFAGAPMDDFPRIESLGDLSFLRYLSFRRSSIVHLPKLIGELHNLETLDLRETYVRVMPREIYKLKKLRHLLRDFEGFEMDGGIGDLTSLQTLRRVNISHNTEEVVKGLEKLTQLRVLGLTQVEPRFKSFLCSLINKMQHLEKLYITARDGSTYGMMDLHFDVFAPVLQKVRLMGRLKKFPNWVAKLQNLVTLSLSFTELTHDPLPLLKDLPNLTHLSILLHAYISEVLQFPNRGFPNLKQILLADLFPLKSIVIEDGALPSLEKLKLFRIRELTERTTSSMDNRMIVGMKKVRLSNSPLQHRQPFTSSSPHNFLDHSPLPLSSSYSPFPLSFTFQRPAPMLSTPLRFKRYCASPSNNNNNNLSDPPLTTQFPHLDGFRFPVSSGFSQFFQPSVLDSDRGVSSSSSSLAFQPKLKLPLSQYYKPPEEQDIKLDIEFNDPSFQSSSTGLLGDLLFEAQAMASGKNSKKRGYLSLNEGNNWYVVSIDPRRVYVKDPNDVQLKTIRVSNSGPNGEEYAWYQCTVNGGREGRPVGAYELAKAVEELGAGEILRNCIDCDGQGKGFDVDLIKLISDAVSIPVIASGGAGAPQHFSEGNDFDLLTIHLLSDNSGFQMDSGIGDLTSLQTLRAVDLRHNTEEVVKGLEKLTQLRESEEMVGWGGIKSLRRSGRGRFWRKERLERKLGLRRNHWLLELFGTANLATTPPLFAAVVRSPPVAATTTTVINYFLESWSLMEGMANISDDASNGENGFLAMFGGDESGGGGSGGVGSSGDQGGGNVEDVALKKGPWTTAEDVILMDYVTKNGEGNWNAVQRNTGLNRCGKSCRHRWANHLRPNLKKGAFSPEEEKLIVDLHAQFGNKWARMAALDQTPPKAGSPFNTIVPQHQPPPTTPFPCLTPTGSNPNIATSFELFNQNQQHHQQQQYQYQQQQYQQHPLSPTASHHSLLSSPLQHRQPFTSSSPHNFLDHSPLPLSSSSSPSPLSFTFQRPAPMLSTPLRFKRYCASPSYNNNLSDPPLTTQFPHLDGLRFPVSSGFSQFFQPSLLDSDRGVSSSSSSLAFQPKLELPLSQYYKPPEEQDIKLDIEFNDPSFQSSSSGLMGDLLFEAQAMASGKNSKKRGYLSLNEGNNVFEDFPSSSLYGPSSTSEPKPKEEAPDFSKFMNGDLSSLLTVIPSSNMQGHEWHNNSAREMSNVQSSVSGMTDDNFGLDIKPIASLFPLSNTTNHDENQGCYSWDNLPGLC